MRAFLLYLFLLLSFFHLKAAKYLIPDGDIDSLAVSIHLSNDNNQRDTIFLAPDGLYTFEEPFDLAYHPDSIAALPSPRNDVLGVDLVIEGRGAILFRSNARLRRFRALFMDRVHVVIKNTIFQKFSTVNNDGAILKAEDNSSLELYNCEFQESEQLSFTSFDGGGAVTVFRSDSLIIKNCRFADNKAIFGAGLYVTKTRHLEIDHSTFLNNSGDSTLAGKFGGAALRFDLTDGDSSTWRIKSSLFEQNVSYKEGGAITGTIGEKVSLKIEDCTFRQNTSFSTATDSGGAAINLKKDISSMPNIVEINNSKFFNNRATGNGGAIYSQIGLKMQFDSLLDNTSGNSGGAIFLEFEGSDTLHMNQSVFINNSAQTHGGATFLRGSYYIVQNCEFNFNSAGVSGSQIGNGGGIYSEAAISILNSPFLHNSSQNLGGAALLKESSRIHQSSFEANIAGLSGGALYLESNDHIISHSTLLRNHAGGLEAALGNGGAIYSLGNTQFTRINFAENLSGFAGGAIYIDPTGIINSEFHDCIFSSNKTGMEGGAMWFSGDNFRIETSKFKDNYAGSLINRIGKGGAIYGNGRNNILNCIFQANTAGDQGGAAYLNTASTGSSFTEIRQNAFFENRSGANGGAIFLKGDNHSITNSLIAFNQTGDTLHRSGLGGGIYVEGSISISHSTIAYNESGRYAGGIIAGPNTNLNASLLVSNKAHNPNNIRQNSSGLDTLITGNNPGAYFSSGQNNIEFPPIEESNLADNAYATQSGAANTSDPLLYQSISFLCDSIPVLPIAKGSNAIDPSGTNELLDQRGNPIIGSSRDIGAFEYEENANPKVNIEQLTIPIRGYLRNNPVKIIAEFNPKSNSNHLSPAYHWFINGSQISTNEGAELSADLQEDDMVYVIMQLDSTENCHLPTSVESGRISIEYKNADSIRFSNLRNDLKLTAGNPEANEIKLSADIVIEDTSFIKNIFLNYKGISEDENSWRSQALERSDFTENTISVSSPQESWLQEIGMEYRFVGTNVSGQESISDISYVYINYPDEGIILSDKINFTFGKQSENYHMFSVPMSLEKAQVSSVLFDNLGDYIKRKWRLLHYQNGNFSECCDRLNTISPGKSYFLAIADEKNLSNGKLDTGQGKTLEVTKESPFEISLNRGYNQIGNPYPFDINLTELQSANPSLTNLTLISYENGSWGTSEKLKSHSGYFVEIIQSSPANLIFPVMKSGKKTIGRKKNRNSIDKENWAVFLNLKNSEIDYQLAGLGMHPSASDQKDIYDLSVPPRFNKFLELEFIGSDIGSSQLTRNFVPTSTFKTWEFEIKSSIKESITELSWENEYFGKNEFQLFLLDLHNQKVVNMRERNSYSFFYSENGNRFRVIYGSEKEVSKRLKPDAILLGLPFPNPIRKEGIIPFSLTEDESSHLIEVSLYDLLGRKVLVIHQGEFEPGFHEIVWKPEKTDVPPGNYLIVLTRDGNLVGQRKILLQP